MSAGPVRLGLTFDYGRLADAADAADAANRVADAIMFLFILEILWGLFHLFDRKLEPGRRRSAPEPQPPLPLAPPKIRMSSDGDEGGRRKTLADIADEARSGER